MKQKLRYRAVLPAAALALTLAPAATAASLQTAAIAQPEPHTGKPIVAPEERFRFAIVSDRTGGARPGVFQRAIQDINLLKPAFVISVGDLLEGYTDNTAAIASQWQEMNARLAEFDMRFYMVAGNHDLSNTAMLKSWREQFGSPSYSFLYKNTLFLIIDTDDPTLESLNILPRLFPEPGKAEAMQALVATDPKEANELISARIKELNISVEELVPAAVSQEQANWAIQTLAAHKDVRWTIVLMHKPAWLYQSEGNKFPQIEAALAKRPYTVIAGHEHYYQHDVRNGRDYFRLGTTGGEWIRNGPGAVDHISWVTVDDDGPHLANIRVGGVFGHKGPKEEETRGVP